MQTEPQILLLLDAKSDQLPLVLNLPVPLDFSHIGLEFTNGVPLGLIHLDHLIIEFFEEPVEVWATYLRFKILQPSCLIRHGAFVFFHLGLALVLE